MVLLRDPSQGPDVFSWLFMDGEGGFVISPIQRQQRIGYRDHWRVEDMGDAEIPVFVSVPEIKVTPAVFIQSQADLHRPRVIHFLSEPCLFVEAKPDI